MNNSKYQFLILGVIFSLINGIYIFVAIMSASAPPGTFYLMFSMMIMSFCLSYLYPEFKHNDERVKLIKQKGVFTSFLVFMGYLMVFFTIFQFWEISITALYTLQIFAGLMISTVFLSFVVYSKLY